MFRPASRGKLPGRAPLAAVRLGRGDRSVAELDVPLVAAVLAADLDAWAAVTMLALAAGARLTVVRPASRRRSCSAIEYSS